MYKLVKPYKEENPIVTVNKIRSILNEIGIFVSELFSQDGDYYTCRIEIANDDLIEYHIGTNGKGTSIEYAFASAYAEFMERLQNKFLIRDSFYFSKYYDMDCSFNRQLKVENKKLDFLFGPDEKVLPIAEIIDDNFDVLSSSLFINDKKELEDLILKDLKIHKSHCVQFYHVQKRTIQYLPISILLEGSGSTGMCAGNTPEEALIQGLSEILERYAVLEIYYKQIVPPTIPHDYFKDYPIYDSIKRLENKGLTIIIKDFSLGIGLPVIGVIVIDNASRKYNVKVGSDPWPLTSLERCLTEFHQSFTGIRLIDKYDFGKYLSEKFDGLDQSEADFLNLSKILNNATGQWPDSLFSDCFTYNFTSLNFELGKSNKSDLNYLIRLISQMGYQIFIRDVSYLGFCSYYIVVPGLSQDKRNKTNYKISFDLYQIKKMINDIPSLSDIDLTSLIHLLEKNYKAISEGLLNFEDLFYCNTDCDIDDITIDLLLCMAHYKMKNINEAYIYMEKFLKDKCKKEYIYFFCCKDYLALLMKKMCMKDIVSYMEKIYGINLTNEVIGDMKDPEFVFKSYDMHSYFSTKNHNISNFKYFKISNVLKNIELKQKSNLINQVDLSNYLDNIS